MNKSYAILLFCIILLGACSPEKLLLDRNYDMALDAAFKRLERKPHDAKYLKVVGTAADSLNAKAIKQIEILAEIGNAQSWERTYEILGQTISIQERIDALAFKPKQTITINNAKARQDEAGKNAALTLVAEADLLMQKNNSQSAREAWVRYKKAQRYNQDLEELEQKIKAAQDAGYTYVIYQLMPNERNPMPEVITNIARNPALSRLSRNWIIYHDQIDLNTDYDYTIQLTLLNHSVGSNSTTSRTITEKAEVVTGQEPVKDAEGKIITNAQGKPIMRDVKSTVTATVKIYTQEKLAQVAAQVQIIDNLNGNIQQQFNISGTERFSHDYATYKGDKRALSRQSANLTKQKAVAFPSTASMLQRATQELNDNLRSRLVISQNQFR